MLYLQTNITYSHAHFAFSVFHINLVLRDLLFYKLATLCLQCVEMLCYTYTDTIITYSHTLPSVCSSQGLYMPYVYR